MIRGGKFLQTLNQFADQSDDVEFFRGMYQQFLGLQQEHHQIWGEVQFGFSILGTKILGQPCILERGIPFKATSVGSAMLQSDERITVEYLFPTAEQFTICHIADAFLDWIEVAGNRNSVKRKASCKATTGRAEWMSLLWNSREQHAEKTDQGWLWRDPFAASLSTIRESGLDSVPKSPNPNDPRDKWIYEQCCDTSRAFMAIKFDLEGRAKTMGWDSITTIPGVKSAAERYAKRHELQEIPIRQSGRPKK